MDTQVWGKIKLKEFEIACIAYFDSTDEDFAELKYIHIMTGQECDTLDQIFVGWSEQEKDQNKSWDELIRRIKLNDDLLERLAENKIGTYHYQFTIDVFGEAWSPRYLNRYLELLTKIFDDIKEETIQS